MDVQTPSALLEEASADIVRRRPRKALVADLFFGAGGSSSGARRALARLGLRMELVAVNHWDVAIATHSRNHPDARHYVEDVNTAKPWELVPEGHLDLLLASPECRFHSRARGGRPISDQQRMDPWCVVRWCSDLRIKRILIENVPEFVDWGPCDTRTGRPIKSRKGEYFRAWCQALRAIGFQLDWRIVNCADFGDATTRQRFFLMGRSDGKALCWPQATHAPRHKAPLLGAKPWRASREVIDWSYPGKSIFRRKRPLVRATLERIEAGFRRFGGVTAEPFIVVLRRHMDGLSLDDPLPTITAKGNHLWLATPFVLSQGGGGVPRPVDQPMPTIVTDGAIAMVEPLIAPYYGDGSGKTCKPVSEPLDTVTAKGRFGLVEPIVMPIAHRDGSHRARPVSEPLPTVTCANRGELALVEPFVFPVNQGEGRMRGLRSVEQPLPTILTRDSLGLVEPAIDGAEGVEVLIDGVPHTLDIRYRMLQPHELAAAMSFTDADLSYEFAGTKTDIIRQIGNAVPVRTSAALVGAIMET